MNYTEASSTCYGHRGYLAQIMSDTRTNFLSFQIEQRIADLSKTSVMTENVSLDDKPIEPVQIPIRHAFIGLREFQRKGNFVDSFNIPIQCYLYRAWHPNYPT